jgi:acyl carrier protein
MKETVMENKEIFNKVATLIEDVSGKHRNEILLTHTFDNDLYMDSLDHVELIMYVEEEFGLEIADKDAEKLETVKDLVEYLEKNI